MFTFADKYDVSSRLLCFDTPLVSRGGLIQLGEDQILVSHIIDLRRVHSLLRAYLFERHVDTFERVHSNGTVDKFSIAKEIHVKYAIIRDNRIRRTRYGSKMYIIFSPTVKYILVRRLLRSRKPRNVHVVYRCFRLIFVARIINTYRVRVSIVNTNSFRIFWKTCSYLDNRTRKLSSERVGFWLPDVLPVRRGISSGLSSQTCTSARVRTDFLDVRPDGRVATKDRQNHSDVRPISRSYSAVNKRESGNRRVVLYWTYSFEMFAIPRLDTGDPTKRLLAAVRVFRLIAVLFPEKRPPPPPLNKTLCRPFRTLFGPEISP